MGQQPNKVQTNEPNIYIEELKKFIGQEVTVIDMNGKEFSGICKAISFMHLNIILMTNDEKIIIKNISYIKRKRTYQKDIKTEKPKMKK